MLKNKENKEVIDVKEQLKQWRQWKRTIILLEEAKTKLKSNYDQKMITKAIEQYDEEIGRYTSLVEHLETAIRVLLSKEEKAVAIIFTNEEDYLNQGYSKGKFEQILTSAVYKLEQVLLVGKKQEKKT